MVEGGWVTKFEEFLEHSDPSQQTCGEFLGTSETLLCESSFRCCHIQHLKRKLHSTHNSKVDSSSSGRDYRYIKDSLSLH
jgi:hypothetical protein